MEDIKVIDDIIHQLDKINYSRDSNGELVFEGNSFIHYFFEEIIDNLEKEEIIDNLEKEEWKML